MEYYIGYIGITVDEFWSMTLFELSCKSRGHRKRTEDLRRQDLIHAYYCGAFSQADLKAYPISKWSIDILPEEEQNRIKEDKFKESANLWEVSQRS